MHLFSASLSHSTPPQDTECPVIHNSFHLSSGSVDFVFTLVILLATFFKTVYNFEDKALHWCSLVSSFGHLYRKRWHDWNSITLEKGNSLAVCISQLFTTSMKMSESSFLGRKRFIYGVQFRSSEVEMEHSPWMQVSGPTGSWGRGRHMLAETREAALLLTANPPYRGNFQGQVPMS